MATDACDEWFSATADDIGARILAQVMIEDEDVVKAKMLEYGPIKEDPEVRSKVEMYLERKSVLFMVNGRARGVWFMELSGLTPCGCRVCKVWRCRMAWSTPTEWNCVYVRVSCSSWQFSQV